MRKRMNVEEKEERREKREQQRESKYKREIENKSKRERERETVTFLRCSYGKIVKERKGKKGMHFS
jgi:ribosome-binding protein aMBF1 (putative translation factor)